MRFNFQKFFFIFNCLVFYLQLPVKLRAMVGTACTQPNRQLKMKIKVVKQASVVYTGEHA